MKNKYSYCDDDLSLVDNKKIKFIDGEKRNFKITDKFDFELLKDINKSNIKLGIGFDVHRLVKGRSLFLGGKQTKGRPRKRKGTETVSLAGRAAIPQPPRHQRQTQIHPAMTLRLTPRRSGT